MAISECLYNEYESYEDMTSKGRNGYGRRLYAEDMSRNELERFNGFRACYIQYNVCIILNGIPFPQRADSIPKWIDR